MGKRGNLKDLHIFDTLLGSAALVHSNPFAHETSDISKGSCKVMSGMKAKTSY